MKSLRCPNIILTSACLFSFIFIAHGQEETKTVSPDRGTEKVVLTAEDFAKLNCENVGDALQNLSGVTVGSMGEVSLRDVSSSKVVIIFDGQKLNVAGGTGVQLNSISIENIEKIELLRGGRSAQYGADAVGGVIVITSKTKQDSETESTSTWDLGLRGSYGSYNKQIYGLTHSLTEGNFNYFLNYKRETWDGNFEYTNPYGKRVILENNHKSSHFAFFKAGMVLSENQSINGSVSYYNTDDGTPGMTETLTPEARIRFDNWTYNLKFDQKNLFKDFNLKVQTYYLDYQTKFDNPQVPYPVHSTHNNYALGIDLQQAGSITEMITLIYGYSFRNDEIESTEVGNKKRDTHSAFSTATLSGEVDHIISSWDVALAVRYDYPSDFDPEFSPRLSLTLAREGAVNTSLRSHITRSYRAPSFNDLYWPRDAFAIGNPDLQPEIGINYDVGINLSFPYQFVNTSFAVNYFNNNVTDLILWAQDPAVDNLWTPKNISETLTTGLETSATLDFFKGKAAINVEYTYMKALDKGPDPSRHNKYLIYRPKNKLAATLTARFFGFEWNLIDHYVGLRYTNPANTKYMESVNLIDTNLTYRFKTGRYNWIMIFEATNLANKDYQMVDLTAEPGRMFKGTIGINL